MKEQFNDILAPFKSYLFQQTKINAPANQNTSYEGSNIKDPAAPKKESLADFLNSYHQNSAPVPKEGAESYEVGSSIQDIYGNTIPLQPTPRTIPPEVLLTDEEIFNAVNPPEYINAISYTQDHLISVGFLKEEGRLPLDSDDNIINTQLKGVEYLMSQGYISPEDYNRAVIYLNTDYRVFREMEVERVKQEHIQGISLLKSPVKKYKTISSDEGNPSKILVFLSFAERFGFYNVLKTTFKIFLSKNAMAYSSSGNWVTSPECWKDLSPTGSPIGFNGWSFCCNCGLFCSEGCEYFEDCGPYGADCNVPFGCLNGACESYPNAIWDPFIGSGGIGTGICGCG
ncbi:MAG: hypothetical protein COU46_02095 [Candidatus Niyogibacteria bacterium CG10_big_fil_rev_8_21_14_0_10_42_19]|uniref:Uncharacterized protein n=1 Tax=Candidatus Niyogibacteria bacterium CG10_big_fil_rev_8_21_14_0_10_42_19 TaxID=1974725 RepID=A0A2H0TFJ1_9BACT|nr:MAG: hypothetical protein COU46_02095 [Candidatus Niyogibacteria bacterium CG10_big_fil_rev_8_21_14_0_10_42_19]